MLGCAVIPPQVWPCHAALRTSVCFWWRSLQWKGACRVGSLQMRTAVAFRRGGKMCPALFSMTLNMTVFAWGVAQKVEAGEAPPRESKPSANGTPKAGKRCPSSVIVQRKSQTAKLPHLSSQSCCRRHIFETSPFNLAGIGYTHHLS